MEAIYWGNSKGWSRGVGVGPWVMADIENGLWAGNNSVETTNTPVVGATFVTAMVKGGSDGFALLGGDAAKSGSLEKKYEGARTHPGELKCHPTHRGASRPCSHHLMHWYWPLPVYSPVLSDLSLPLVAWCRSCVGLLAGPPQYQPMKKQGAVR